MLRIIISIIAVSFLTSCNSSRDNPATTKERTELVPEADKKSQEASETQQIVKNSDCMFLNPDTSLSKVRLRDSESSAMIITADDKIDAGDHYYYYSTMYRETLTMTQFPGDGKYQISIFKVEYSDKADHGYRKLNIDTFKTEKGIKLGLNKKEIIERLGSCYVAKDSTKNYIELYYRIETPKDSQTKILENNNMPVYYASYKLWSKKLARFEFGFEYP
jgi:hypothetical protein